MQKRLYRSSTNKVFAGVCGGLGEYFDVDPVLVRIITVILILGQVGVIAYLLAWIIIPKREFFGEEVQQEEVRDPQQFQNASWGRYWPGLILIGIGVVLLVREHWFWFTWHEFWPVALILIGLALIFRRTAKKDVSQTQTANGEQPHANNGGSQV
jgi:phage shock protein C